MTSPALWAEITIAGFFYLLAAFFLTLKVIGVRDLSFLPSLKDYVAAISVGIVVVSYLLGLLAHRLIPIVLSRPVRFLARRMKITGHWQ